MTHPAQAIAGVVSLVAIIGVVGALRLTPDAGTEKLVDRGSAAFEGTEEFRERFGDDAIAVLVSGDLRRLVLSDQLVDLLQLEACLSGNAPPGDPEFPEVCDRIAALGATRVVFGPATFLNQSAGQATQFIGEQTQRTYAEAELAGRRAARRAAREGLSPQQQEAAGLAAAEEVVGEALADFEELAARVGEFGLPSISNQRFIRAIVFDPRLPSGTPKSRFGYLFPSSESALISIRLEPEIGDETRREAIDLIRSAVEDPAFAIEGGGYEVSGVPVIVEGLADELGGEILLLASVALAVMALTLLAGFGPPLRLLPLFVAVGAAATAFGLLSIVGGTLTMASVAVLPVVIGLGVDYAIQLQARFREAAAAGERPPAAAVIAAVRSGPVIATAALATAAGFLALALSPIPMVREFAFALVVGIVSALAISISAGLAALSVAAPAARGSGDGGRAGRARTALAGRARALGTAARHRVGGLGRSALGAAIATPGRVLLVAAVLAVTGWVAGTRTEVVSDIRELAPGDLPALESLDELQAATGVSNELDVIVRGEDVTTPEAITWMRDFKRRVLEQQGFTGDFADCRAEGIRLCPGPALPDLLAAAEEPSQGQIDGVLGVVPDYFLQAILSRPERGDQVASISFLGPVMPLEEQEALIGEIRAELDPPPGLSAEVVGLPVLVADATAELSGSRYWMTLAGLGAVALVLLAVYRSPARALVPLIPIAFATGWSALVLAAMGVPLNPMSATLGALVIAVSTEFSVILAARYEEERAVGGTVGESLRRTYSRTGTAVLLSGLTSIAGFGVLIASEITMLRDFGLVTLVDLSVALLGVMLVLPAALVWADGGFRPFPAIGARLRRHREAVPESGSAG